LGKVATQDRSQDPAGDDEVHTILWEVKLFRSGSFVGSKRLPEGLYARYWQV
jgi:hypothetical protein